ncbi:mtDNA inheritance, partitioning of the mitochondrial organelle [Mucor velutinosus]|uniref:Nucleoside diphosphate kinase n=1 Tax=Mucor velutinosus TaxID=708070 RepID=A0AAN7DD52_9FUNG|nr:mtDNA inheritance, partitioning of the mitochondrial organelle [Mucor velutinosus]
MSTLEHEMIPATAASEDIPSTAVALEQEHEKVHQDETPVSSITKNDARAESPSRTLALIKPDAMQAAHKDEIIEKIKENGFRIVQEQQIQLSKEKVGLFYKEHEEKPFYQDLTNWMSSSPIYALVLEKQDAVQAWRHLMGPTNSNKARDVEPNSIRALFGTDGSHNATHGSDSQASAEREIALIFGNDKPHVVEVQGLKDEFETQDVCKPDAVDESNEQHPEVTKEPEAIATTAKVDDLDTRHATVDHEADEVEPTVDTKHLHTADLVTSQDNVTDLSQKEDETINPAPEDMKKDETTEIRVAADAEEEEAAVVVDAEEEGAAVVADPVVVSLDAKLDLSLEDTIAATTADKDDNASKEEQVVKATFADDNVPDTKEAPAAEVSNANEAPVTNALNAEEISQVGAIATVTVEASTTDANDIAPDTTKDTKETDKPDTTFIANNTKEDAHFEEKKDTKQIEKEPVLEKQDVKLQPETVTIEAEIVAENDTDEDHAEAQANAEEQQEIEAIIHVEEAKVDAVLEPVASAPVAMETLETEPTAVTLEAEEEKELLNAEQGKKQEEPVAVAIHADIVTADAQDNDDDANQHQQHGVTSGEVFAQENETQQTNVIVVAHDDVDADKPLDTPKEKNMTEDHQNVKSNESVTQEKEGDLISTTPTTTTTATATTTDTDANILSSGNSSDSSKNSSVTADKSQVKENIKETHVNKKQPKLKAPAAAGASSVGHPRSAAIATTTTTADKKKATSTGLRKPTSTLKKKTAATSSSGADAEDEKDKPKPKTRVPRVALLSQQTKKKPVTQDDASANTEIKTKKAAVSTRSLVSRLTAPTAASARKKTSSAAEGTTTTTTTTTPKPADPARQKKISSAATKKVPTTTATTGSHVSKAFTTSKPANATAAATTTALGVKKPSTTATGTKTTGGVRRISPPTSTTASKKADGTAVKRTTGTTGTRAAASGLPSSANPGKTSTRKETLSTGSKLKKTAPTPKKPSAATLTTPKKIKKADTAVESPTASSASKASSESSHGADHHDSADMEASATPSSVPASSSHPDEAVETTKSEHVANDTNEAEANAVLDSTSNENDSTNHGGVDQESINESEIGSDVITSSQDVTEIEKKATEKQDDIIVDLPKQETNNEQDVESAEIGAKEQEQEVESVEIGAKEQEQDKVLIIEPSANQASDAEVAAITANNNNNNNHTTPVVAITSNKPQMASLRSRFENLNNNSTNNTLNHNQLQTTSSKEIRSKSPNRISDMINRFQ